MSGGAVPSLPARANRRNVYRAQILRLALTQVVRKASRSGLFSASKTARTIIRFPILIAPAKQFGWDIIGFCLPIACLINQV